MWLCTLHMARLIVSQRDDVLRSLHAEARSSAWTECDGQVSSQLYLKTSGASVRYIPQILEAGVKVMMFAGAEDLICNYKGIENMLDNMSWSGTKGLGVSLRLSDLCDSRLTLGRMPLHQIGTLTIRKSVHGPRVVI